MTIKNSTKKKSLYICAMVILVLFSFVLRIVGISKQLSYWNDESQVALMSKEIFDSKNKTTAIVGKTGVYQIGLYILTAISFDLFGISELSGRFPSVIAGIILIIAGFFVTREILNPKRAVIVSFLLAFSQIQLAWSTQLRPYVWLELFTLIIVYFLYKYLLSKKILDYNIAISILVTGMSVLFHGTGLLNLLIISLVFIYKLIKLKKYKYLLLIPVFVVTGIIVVFNSFTGGWEVVKRSLLQLYLSPFHYRIFLTHNYLWLVTGSLVGFLTLFKKNRELAVLFGGSILLIFSIAIFKINPNYVRYSLPAFPLMYILFAEGVVSVIEKLTKKIHLQWLLILLAFTLLSQTGKFVFWPRYYYSINADVRENPIVNYKIAFTKIKELVRDKQDVIIMDAWNDRVPWYLPGQKFIFLADPKKFGNTDPVYGEEVLSSIDDFMKTQSTYKSGIVIVEDWESLTPDVLKNHIRSNLKFEFTVQDLPYNENDHWGISVYSWGI